MEQKRSNNTSNILYAVIGIATLMVATMGATFAYFTATQSNNSVIKGNMATIGFDLTVTKVTDVDETKGGLIPMSNNMMEKALTANAGNNGNRQGICVDDNNNAVCQVYKITAINTSTASMFLDGYVTLSGGSGVAADYTATSTNKTTMRWAQAFCSTESGGKVTACTTAGNSTVRPDTGSIAFTGLGGTTVASNGLDTTEIKSTRTDVTLDQANGATIQGNKYEVINKNYIRVSDHVADNYNYTRASDTTSALVYSQYLDANDNNASNNTGTSSTTFTDAQVFYIVVWLSETGTNQTIGATGAATTATDFFKGNVTFISAEGNQVTATFSGHTKVPPTA